MKPQSQTKQSEKKRINVEQMYYREQKWQKQNNSEPNNFDDLLNIINNLTSFFLLDFMYYTRTNRERSNWECLEFVCECVIVLAFFFIVKKLEVVIVYFSEFKTTYALEMIGNE